MSSLIDVAGQKFNRLTVIERAGQINHAVTWKCVCDCGNVVIVRESYLKSGHTKSCGCYRREKSQASGRGDVTRRYRKIKVSHLNVAQGVGR